MKNLLLSIIILLTLLLPLPAYSTETQVKISITGMTCSLWPIAIKKSLSGVEGVNRVEVSYKEGRAVVTADDAVAEKDLLEAIEKAGPYSGMIKRTDIPEWYAYRRETQEPT